MNYSIPPRSLYIHVPFCLHRCGYCDFTLVAGRDHLIDSYLRALALEIEASGFRGQEMDTIFLGGGTPTHLACNQLRELLSLIEQNFPRASDAEYSVEANPADLGDDVLTVLADAGVNRISLGVQSFDDRCLLQLERDHRRVDLLESIPRVQRLFDNVSFDLIFAVPGQAQDDWINCLNTAIEFHPTHLSTYGLTFEKGTSFWARREKGQLAVVDDAVERAMYAAAMDRLTSAGYEQYEISSFARPTWRCRHNQVYWSGQSWLGFGPGAATFRGDCRYLNHRSVTTWLKKVLTGHSAVLEEERLEPLDRAKELLVLGLRRMDGVNRGEFCRMNGMSIDDMSGPTIRTLVARGLLAEDSESVKLSAEGRFFYDSVAAEILS